MVWEFLARLKNGARWTEQQQTSILSAALVITLSFFLSSLTGLLNYRLLTSRFYDPISPTQLELDSYWVASQPSDLVFQLLIIGALSAAFIPVFTRYQKKDKQEAFHVASSVMNVVLAAFVVVALIVIAFAPQIIHLMTGTQFTETQIQLAASMTRVMIIAQFFFAISNFLSGMIQSYKRFIIPAFSPVAYNLGITFGILVLGEWFGIFGPVYGMVTGAFLHMVIQLPLAKQLGFRYELKFDLSHPGVQEIFRLMGPRAFSVGIDLIQPYALTFFITSIANANLTLMKFAQRLMAIPIRLFGVPIGQAALPFLSSESDMDHKDRFRSLLTQSLHQVLFFALPASVLLLILRIPIVRFAFGASNFPWADTVLTGRLVAILSLSVAAQAMTHVLVRGFYAMHDTVRPFGVSIMTMILSVLGGWWVSFQTDWALLGLAIVISLAGIIETVSLLFLMHLKLRFKAKELAMPQLKMITAAILMGGTLYAGLKLLDVTIIDTSRTLGLFVLSTVVSLAGLGVYLFFSWVLKVEQLVIVRSLWGRMSGWSSALAKSPEAIDQQAEL